ncbi:MAG: autotransporter domain-containing protein, partial [Planctomycetaceae bacterium]|nr:autotransporter domain-containing protein [Planctomycetaceae bacterium]
INNGAHVTFKSSVTITALSGYPGKGGLWISTNQTKGSTAIFEDAVEVQNNGIALYNSTAVFHDTVQALDISINATTTKEDGTPYPSDVKAGSMVTFKGEVNVAGDVEIMDGPSTVVFEEAVTAGEFNIDSTPWDAKNGTSKITFHKSLTLTGIDESMTIGGNNYDLDLAVMEGENIFKGAVTVARSGGVDADNHAVFMRSTNTFENELKVGNGAGTVVIGHVAELMEWFDSEDNENYGEDHTKLVADPNFYKQAATVTLKGDSAKITANVDVREFGTLNVDGNGTIDGNVTLGTGSTFAVNLNADGNATVDGNVTFGAGSTFAINAANNLTVTGTADISKDAFANIQGVAGSSSIGKEVLTAASIIGDTDADNNVIGFGAHASSLYKVGVDGNSVRITGMNKVEDVLESNNIATANSAASAAMTTSILNDTSVPEALRTKLSDTIQEITTLAGTDARLAEVATMQLFGENVLAAASATQTTAESFSTGINSHQIQLRDQASAAGSGVSSGDGFASINPRYYRHNDTANRIWAAGFGAWTKQRDRNGQPGYKYDAGGFILGYDREYGNFVFGISGAYSNGDIKNNDGFTKTDIDTFNVGLYGSYNPACSGLFVDANVGFGFAWNDVNTNVALGGTEKGKYRNTSFQAGGNVGYTFNFGDNFRFVPTVGLQYTHIHQEAWQEIATGNGTANFFEKNNSDFVSIPVAVRLNKTFEFGNGVRITPELRGAFIYEAKKNQPKVQMGYVGANYTTTIYGIDSGRSRGLVGAGVKAKLTRNVDVFVDYNFAFRKKYTSHNIMAGLGLSF